MRSALKKLLGPRGLTMLRRLRGREPVGDPPLLESVREIVLAVEADQGVQDRAAALSALRRLGLDDFGLLLLSMPNTAYPKLSRLLPAMASSEVQEQWTGSHGVGLLRQTLTFVRSVAYNYAGTRGQDLADATVLDFGCGYGRIARLMYYFVPESQFFGVDPWDRSIELCRAAGLSKNFFVSDYLPESLPVGEARFDLGYAFSVFTHLSERATRSALKVLRSYVKPDGMLAITIRPIEYWNVDVGTTPAEKLSLKQAHRERGFAFQPHRRDAVDGDVTYGDTSLSLDWLSRECPQWTVRRIDRSLDDPQQIYVFLRPA